MKESLPQVLTKVNCEVKTSYSKLANPVSSLIPWTPNLGKIAYIVLEYLVPCNYLSGLF